MDRWWKSAAEWALAPESGKTPGHLGARWLFFRALGVIYFSAFYSLFFQVKGLIGPDGLLPADVYLNAISRFLPGWRGIWFAPSVFRWAGASGHALIAGCWIGMAAAALLFLNFWPRAMNAVCLVCFLSFIAILQDFSSYQSDGMLLEAGFLCLFFAPPGLRPRWGEAQPPSRAALFLLQWEWFRIYFESGIGKMLSGDPEWRHLTAMYEYYQNGPLPTWIGWYVQLMPHWFHWLAALATLVMEMGIVWLMFLPRRFRLVCFFLVTPWEIMVILTANYAFLNYLVLSLGVLLLDDRFLAAMVPRGWLPRYQRAVAQLAAQNQKQAAADSKEWIARFAKPGAAAAAESDSAPEPKRGAPAARAGWRGRARKFTRPAGLALSGVCLGWVFYVTAAKLVWMASPGFPLPVTPVQALEPFRIANQYGLFEVMTRARYEIEFQGSLDGQTWTAYPFPYKPQDVRQPPRIYAPYQPRFDWNLWFASLGNWRQYPFVLGAEEALLENDPDVLSLFAANPFPSGPPKEVRAVLWQYWFTDLRTKRRTGDWWRRKMLGLYAPELEREPDGKFGVVALPSVAPPAEEPTP